MIPYEYSYFDFCPPNSELSSPVENLGQVVFGERIQPSSYKIEFMKNVTCQIVCKKSYTGGELAKDLALSKIRKAISLNYQHHWIVDNMPVTSCYETDAGRVYCSTGFPMGCHNPDSCTTHVTKKGYYIYNHVDLTITYHSGAKEDWGGRDDNVGRIISVKIVPKSIKHSK